MQAARIRLLSMVLTVVLCIPAAMAAEIIKDDDPGLRNNVYIDDTRDGFLSQWKIMLSNTLPEKLFESGRWFEAAPIPRPFAAGEVVPFSDGLRVKLRDNSTDGLIVVKDGAIVGQYFRWGFGIDDIHLIHSTGKVFTSFAIQPVYDRIGSEGLNRPLKDYLPRLVDKFFGEATLAQTLDMKNGMEWTENYDDPTSATMLSGPVAGWDPLDPAKGAESWYERMFSFDKYGEHGQTWVYNNASVIGASFAAAAIARRPFSELVQQSYDRLGFEDRSYYVANVFGELSAEGGQALTIRDHAKLGRYMIEELASPYVDDVWNVVGRNDDPANAVFIKKYGFAKAYKNYWYKLDDHVIAGIGSSGIFLYVDRSKNLVISKYSSFVQGQGAEEFAVGFEILEEIAGLY
jgi:CubicO group peptidase (beta-lactamase class C family)